MSKRRLSEMSEGSEGVIGGIGGAWAIRTMEMGVIPGERIRVVRRAPLGDPIEVEVKGYRLTIREAEAREVEIEGEAAGE